MHKVILPISLIYLILYKLLIQYGIFPDFTNWMIDIFAMIIFLQALLIFAINKKFYGDIKYIILFIFILIVIIAGSISSHLSASSIIFGLRQYLKFFPFFLLPLVYDFQVSEINMLLLLLLGLLLLQLPITFFQRFIYSWGVGTGDLVGGSVRHSGALSILLLCSISILYSYYLKKHISSKLFYFLALVLFIPTTINETKATFILFPFVFLLPIIILNDKNFLKKLQKILGYSFIVLIFLSGFVLTYNWLYGKSHASFFDMLSREKQGTGYLYHGRTNIDEVNEDTSVGRFDAIVYAYEFLSRDITKLFFGTGIGTANPKKIKFLISDDLGIQKYHPDISTASLLFWESGLLGILSSILLLFFLFKDSYFVINKSKLESALGLGMASVCLIMIPVSFYINTFYLDPVNIPFFLLSGIVVSIKNKNQKIRAC
jgi:hypothetical protein